MRISGVLLASALLAGAGLSGCGGVADIHNQQAGSGPVSADPTPVPTPTPVPGGQVITAFVDRAHKASCAENRNRLFLIDGKQVFWDHAGNCPDMSYEQVLYGATPQ